MTTLGDIHQGRVLDHILVPVGARYVPLNRRTRHSSRPRLVRFESDAKDRLYGDFGEGLRIITPAPSWEASEAA